MEGGGGPLALRRSLAVELIYYLDIFILSASCAGLSLQAAVVALHAGPDMQHGIQ